MARKNPLRPGNKIKYSDPIGIPEFWIFKTVEVLPLVGRVYRFTAEKGTDTLSIPEDRIPKTLRTK